MPGFPVTDALSLAKARKLLCACPRPHPITESGTGEMDNYESSGGWLILVGVGVEARPFAHDSRLA